MSERSIYYRHRNGNLVAVDAVVPLPPRAEKSVVVYYELLEDMAPAGESIGLGRELRMPEEEFLRLYSPVPDPYKTR